MSSYFICSFSMYVVINCEISLSSLCSWGLRPLWVNFLTIFWKAATMCSFLRVAMGIA